MADSAEKLSVAQDRDAWNLYVFRKSREALPLHDLARDLEAEIRSCSSSHGSILDALVRAGEIETGLADIASPDARFAARITDQLAASALGLAGGPTNVLELLSRIMKPGAIPCSHPEGFSYYGLNPLDFADLVESIKNELAPRAAIVGIRSVGSTLGAMVAAALGRAGKSATRITVRPEGEPYRRRATFDAPQLAWISSELEAGTDFLVVDEGPGFSGSTFLSVAAALEKAGVPVARIALLSSRPFLPRAGQNGQAQEWSRFRSYVINYGCNVPAEAGRSLGGGCWRSLLYASRSQWPASWHELERIKHLSQDGKSLLKFEGFGRFGKLARDQAALLGEARFSPCLQGFEHGYGRYDFLRARPMDRTELSRDLLGRMARYCAFRSANFPAHAGNPDLLRAMAQANMRLEFGLDQPMIEPPVERPVYADCRMQPHEWIKRSSGEVLKTDGTGHGDAHLLPGPVDIAWDLAGLIVEWELAKEESSVLLQEYSRVSGDDTSTRIGPYLLLYLVFRMAFCRMGAASLGSSEDGQKLRSAYRKYAQKVSSLLHSRTPVCISRY
jgi:adenine/guanine phosphoribosyltransferase-like PRPP-binding protein